MSKFDQNRIKDGWEKLCTNKQPNRHYENNGHLAVNQKQSARIRSQWATGTSTRIRSHCQFSSVTPVGILTTWTVLISSVIIVQKLFNKCCASAGSPVYSDSNEVMLRVKCDQKYMSMKFRKLQQTNKFELDVNKLEHKQQWRHHR